MGENWVWSLDADIANGRVSVRHMSQIVGGDLNGLRDILTGRIPMTRETALMLESKTFVDRGKWMSMEPGPGVKAVEQEIRFRTFRPVYADSEFIPHIYGPTGLISLALVDNEGNEFYGVNSDVNWEAVTASSWLMDNVVPHLPLNSDGTLDKDHRSVMTATDLRRRVGNFFATSELEAELYAFYATQDMMRILELWDNDWEAMPSFIPKWPGDLQYLNRLKGEPVLPVHPGPVHHALHDARYDRVLHEFLMSCPWAC